MSLDAIGIVSKNIPKTIEFYSLLGLSFKQEGGPDHFEAQTRSGVRLMIDSIDLMKKLNPQYIEPQGTAIVLCFKQESAEKVDGLHKSVLDAGYQSVTDPWDAFWGQRYASVRDPDGNQIDIFADM